MIPDAPHAPDTSLEEPASPGPGFPVGSPEHPGADWVVVKVAEERIRLAEEITWVLREAGELSALAEPELGVRRTAYERRKARLLEEIGALADEEPDDVELAASHARHAVCWQWDGDLSGVLDGVLGLRGDR